MRHKRSVITRIAVSGVPEQEAQSGLAHFLSEFQHRPWLRNVTARWDGASQRLIVCVERDGEDPQWCGRAAQDEIMDCISAYYTCPEGFEAVIEDSRANG
jgi:hypothetical protein